MMNVMLLSVAVWSGAGDATRDLFHFISGAIAIGWELSTQLFHILPENNLGWVIGAVSGAVAYTMLMRRANRT